MSLQVKQEAIDFALKRFMRPDAARYLRPDWQRFWPMAQPADPLRAFYQHKYRPDQARVPAGVPEGGQWTDEDGTGSSSQNPRTRITARISARHRAQCELQYR